MPAPAPGHRSALPPPPLPSRGAEGAAVVRRRGGFFSAGSSAADTAVGAFAAGPGGAFTGAPISLFAPFFAGASAAAAFGAASLRARVFPKNLTNLCS